jgi:hypothetical protein
MNQGHSRQKTTVIHSAGSAVEAVVIRGLLESAGIHSPNPASTDPFPMGEALAGFRDTDVIVLDSQADEARRIIAEYLESNEGIDVENPEESPGNEA